MPRCFNRETTAQSQLPRGGSNHCFLIKLVVCFLISVLGLAVLCEAQLFTLETQLESLAAAYREEASASNQTKLLAFCQRNAKSPQGALGFFLLGYRAFEERRFPEAQEYLGLSLRSTMPVQDYARYYAASVAFELKEFKECQSQLVDFASRFPNSPSLAKARLLFWKSSLEMKDGQAILSSIKGLSNAESNPEALYYQAQSLELLEDPSKAIPFYQRLYYQFPLYANASAVTQSLSRLGGTDFQVPKEWRIGRIEKLFAGRRYSEVLKDLQLLFALDPSAADQPQYQLWQGLSQFGTAQYFAAIQTLRLLRNAPFETAAQAQFNIAECYRKLDNYAQFKQTAEEMATDFAKSRWWEEALFSLGNYNLVRRDLDEAMSFYQRIVDRFPTGTRVKDCHWRVAWYTYREGNSERALDLFLDHLSRFPDSEYRAAALYWAGRAQLRLGRPLDARQVFEAVARRFSTQYYGQLARAQLKAVNNQARVTYRPEARLERALAELTGSKGLPPNPDLTPIRNTSLNSWPRVKTLSQIGLFELAAQELQNRSAYGSSRAIDFQVAHLHVRAKDFLRSTLALRRVFPDYLDLPFNSLPRDIWEMFYPVSYEGIIQREAAKYAIDPFLVMSLIRQESAFDPKAVSSANAHGLMQLLPSTARRLARGMKLPRPSTEQLHEPETNIQLGMRYLSELLQQFDGQTEKVLASYNAGEHRVEAWMSEGAFADAAEFVDTIPFTETRNYVKIINRNYYFYKMLYSSQSSQ